MGASCFKPVLKLAEAFFVYIEPCFLFAIEAEGGRKQWVQVVQQPARVGLLASIGEQLGRSRIDRVGGAFGESPPSAPRWLGERPGTSDWFVSSLSFSSTGSGPHVK